VAAGAHRAAACKVLGISLRSYWRWKAALSLTDQRTVIVKLPKNKLTDYERQAIIDTANSAQFCDLPPCQIVPRLADEGKYIASESSFYRVLRAANQLTHRGRSQPRKRRKPKALTATGPNQVWCWDISYLPTSIRGLFFYLYFVIDIYSRKIVGFKVAHEESAEHAEALFKTVIATENIAPHSLHLHSDNGAPMKGSVLLSTLQQLGVMRSYSRPSVSNDNPYIESMFKTTKYCPQYPGYFETLEKAQQWTNEFVVWYNEIHQHSALKFITPQQRHSGQSAEIFEQRKKVYASAKQRHPERWSRHCRNWNLSDTVVLNPEREVKLAA
jgi:transposase InsO family protein